MNHLKHISLVLFFVFFNVRASLASEIYFDSHLGLSDFEGSCVVNFFKTRPSTGYGFIRSAVVWSREPIVEGIEFFPSAKIKEGLPGFFKCLHQEEAYENLLEFLEDLGSHVSDPDLEKSEKDGEIILSPSNLEKRGTIEGVQEAIAACGTLVVTFGAGMSAGYVPTLLDFFESIGLEKAYSKDHPTLESLRPFIKRIFEEKGSTVEGSLLHTIDVEWKKVDYCTIESTPAHKALKEILSHVEGMGKETFVYTDNIDGIHDKMGIPLSEGEIEGELSILYPTDSIFSEPVVILVCGQSFDFHGVLSTIETKRELASGEVSYFFLNPSPERILVYQGLDVIALREEGSCIDLSKALQIPLDGVWIEGSVHELLPQLLRLLLSKIPLMD